MKSGISDNRIRRWLTLLLALIMAASAALPAAGARLDLSKSQSPFREKASDEYDPSKAPPMDMDFSRIRVLITTGTTSYVNIDLCTDYVINGGPVLGGTIDEPLSLRVKVTGTDVKLTVRSSGEELLTAAEITLTRVTERYEAGYLTLAYCASSTTTGFNYLGSFRFMANSGSIVMINDLPMAYYLYGIIGFELSTNSFPEALKAQALAAKAMGICYMGGDASYDVKDGWSSSIYQGYHGFYMDRLVTMPYCLEVAGEALIYGNTFVPAYYGHANGGETALPSHSNWGTAQDEQYAVVIDDYEFEYPDSSRMIEHVDYNSPSGPFCDWILCKLIADNGIDARRVVSISSILLYDPLPGTLRNMRKLRVRATVEYAVMVETTPEPTPAPTAEPTAEPTETPEAIGRGYIETIITETFTIECSPSELHTLTLTDIDGSGDNYDEHDKFFWRNLKMYWGYAENGGYTLVFGRKGHGIGLSQIGALARANPETHAHNYREILSFYYPVFRITTITEHLPGEDEDPLPPILPVIAYGTVSADNAEVRMGANDLYPVMAYAHRGEHVDILAIFSNEVLKVVYRGNLGYIHVSNVFVDRFPSPKNGVFTLVDGINPSAANFRSQPYGADETIITRLPKNTSMTCWARVGKWCFVRTSTGLWGFISANVVVFGPPYEYVGMEQLSVPRYHLNCARRITKDSSPASKP